MKKETTVNNPFVSLAKEICNGCDLVTSDENKLSTDDVLAAGILTISDFATCTIDDKKVGVVTFTEMDGKFYWGGQSLTNMVNAFCEACGGEKEARADYADLPNDQKVRVSFESTTTRNKNTFIAVTVH